MITVAFIKKRMPVLLLIAALSMCGCDIASSYRPAHQTTLGDFSGSSDYLKRVGIMALANTTMFTSDRVADPFMDAFLDSMASAGADDVLVLPGEKQATAFLWEPPRTAVGEIDVLALAERARQAGLTAVASPMLMDIRVHTRKTGFWIFRDVAYSLQIQTAAALYDAITGSRLALEVLTEEVDIDEDQATIIRNGQEVEVEELVDIAAKMGEELGETMGEAVESSMWLASVIAITEKDCVLAVGSKVGVEVGDRFTVLDGSAMLTGLAGQRYIVPGPKVGEIVINRVTPRQSFGAPESGELPPVGSILVPEP